MNNLDVNPQLVKVRDFSAALFLLFAITGSSIGSIQIGPIRFVDLYVVAIVALSSVISAALFVFRPKSPVAFRILVSFLLILLPLLLSQLTNGLAGNYLHVNSSVLLRSSMEALACISVLCCASVLPWNSDGFWGWVRGGIALALAFYLITWVLDSSADKRYSGLANHKNVVGGIAMCCGWISWLAVVERRKFFVPIFIVSVVAAYVSGARSSLMSLLLVPMLSSVLTRVEIKKPVIVAALIAVLVVPLVYLSMANVSGIDKVEQQFEKITRNKLYSGREKYWPAAFGAWSESAVLGIGYKWLYVYGDGSTNHCHNLFIAKLVQVGLAGFSCFYVYLYLLHEWGFRSSGGVGQACVIGVIIHQCFEVNFTHGGMPIGIAISAVLGAYTSHLRIDHESSTQCQEDELLPNRL